MSLWLYPISKRAKFKFILRDGTRLPVSAESFKALVINKRISEDEWWHIHRNFLRVHQGDEVYVYTGDQDNGIIGYATVKDIRKRSGVWYLNLRFDIARSLQLINPAVPPISAKVVRSWIHYPRVPIVNLQPFESRLEKLLPWSHKRKLKLLPPLLFKKLKLKPFQEITIYTGAKRQQRQLIHDTVIRPASNFLELKGFETQTTNFGKLRVDLLGTKGKRIILVEGKSNKSRQGREEARQALGQLYEYQWYFKKSANKLLQYHLWTVFKNRPMQKVIDFLENYNILVSWIQNSNINHSIKSQKWFEGI